MQVEAYIMPLCLRFRLVSVKMYMKEVQSMPTERRLENQSTELSESCERSLQEIGLILPLIVTTAIMSPLAPDVDIKKNIALDVDIPKLYEFDQVWYNRIFSELIEEIYPLHLNIYTDGSKLENGSTAAAFYIPEFKTVTTYLLHPSHTVLGAELRAIKMALEFILETHSHSQQPVLILTDSKSALQLITQLRPSYKGIIYKIHEIIKVYQGEIRFQWVKAHIGVKGNEVADKAAKQAHLNDRTLREGLEQEESFGCLNSGFLSLWTTLWRQEVNSSGKGRFIMEIYSDIKSRPWQQHKNRTIECAAARLRIGHAGVNKHLFRFNMKEHEICDHCEEEETIQHFLLSCPKYNNTRETLKNRMQFLNVPLSVKNILGGANVSRVIQFKITQALSKFLASTGRAATL